jgi:hypothetical protein
MDFEVQGSTFWVILLKVKRFRVQGSPFRIIFGKG